MADKVGTGAVWWKVLRPARFRLLPNLIQICRSSAYTEASSRLGIVMRVHFWEIGIGSGRYSYRIRVEVFCLLKQHANVDF